MSTHLVEVLSSEYAERIRAEVAANERRKLVDVSNLGGVRAIHGVGGVRLAGEFSVTARDERSGEVEWQWSDKNLLTTYALQQWVFTRLNSFRLGFMPARETPMVSRSSVSTDPTQCVISGDLGSGTIDSATNTRTLSTTFTTPASNRSLGTVFLGAPGVGITTQMGPPMLLAYSLLTPVKTQTTTQTIEVVYKISLTFSV